MKKIHLTLIFLIFGLSMINAQGNYFYYYNSEKIYLDVDKNYLNITVKQGFKRALAAELGFKFEGEAVNSTEEGYLMYKLRFSTPPEDQEYYQKINALRQLENLKHVSLYFERGNGAPSIGTSDTFYVKLNSEGDIGLLEETAYSKNMSVVKQVPYMPLWYILSINPGSADNALDAANYFHETGFFADVDPAFMFNFRHNCTNDPDFGSLWGLDNSSNPAIDINACQAWTITEGSGINVAILDQGIHTSHNDLSANITSAGFDAQSGTPPSVFAGASHGTHVAGTVAAIKDNNLQVVGVSPQSEILPVSHSLSLTPNVSAELASGISWAWQNGADVINNSWGDQGGNYYSQLQSTILEDAIDDALILGRGGLGTLVVFAAGNYGSGGPIMDYPGTYTDNITTAGSITSSGSRSSFSGYGPKLDVVAPGSGILSTFPYNGTGTLSGTSMAAPHITGTLALILSVNPCLTGQEARDVLEVTAQKVGGYSYTATTGRPNGSWDNEMGYGLIDAYAAVQLAQSLISPDLDLYMQDSSADTGSEPNNVTPYMWASEDIWVRVFADNGLIHQNPDYSPMGNPNTVYVKVRNKSCITSSGTEQLKLYWAKAGTSLLWPVSWDGSTYVGGQIMGDAIGTQTIPSIGPGQETIVAFPWVVPNPADYTSINPEPWHFCLLARIDTASDPMTFTEGWDLNLNVKNNNNIVWKNVTIVDDVINSGNITGGVIAVRNHLDSPHHHLLEFVIEDTETGEIIYEEAEVSIQLDETLFEAWATGGYQLKQMEYIEGENKLVITGSPAMLPAMLLGPDQIGTLNLTFQFHEGETEADRFVYHVIQKDTETGAVLGGETYIVNRLQEGEGGDGEEPTPDDYCNFVSISPNPASDEVLVQYNVPQADGAKLLVIGSYGTTGTVEEFGLEPGSSEIVINVSDYPNGYYSLALECGGEIVDVKTLVKQ